MRVVLDTNILISACWSPGGLEARALTLALSGSVKACVSPAVLAEYRDVLTRPKFRSKQERIAGVLQALAAGALHVVPAEAISLAVDEDDNRFLECAVAADALFLITGNLRDYPAACGTVRIVNAREFLNHLGDTTVAG